MITVLRRFFWLTLMFVTGYVAWTQLQRRNAPADSGPAEWPPIEQAPTMPAMPTMPDPTTSGKWVAPVDGGCPDGYPIKAKESSGIYHSPGGRFYDRASPDRCYANGSDAEADGYRASKT